jgi:hypothetical protein
MRKIFLGALILFFVVSGLKEAAAWEAGPTGMCCDADGNCGPCSDGPAYEPPSGDSGGSESYGGESGWTPAPQKSNADLALEKNAKCHQFYNAKDYDKAASCYEEALQLDPNNNSIKNNLKNAVCLRASYIGLKYYDEQNWAMAVKYFQEAYDTCGSGVSNVADNLRNAKFMLKSEEEARAQEKREKKVAESKSKIDKDLDDLLKDLRKRSKQSGGLEFIKGFKEPPVPRGKEDYADLSGSRGEFYFVTVDNQILPADTIKKAPLTKGTRMVTAGSGKIVMTLPDNTTFTLGPNSDMRIDEFIWDPSTDLKKTIISVAKGMLRLVTGLVTRNKTSLKVTVDTPIMVIGPRGTDFELTVKPDGSGFVILYSGELELAVKKNGAKIIMKAGQRLIFDADGSVGRPEPIPKNHQPFS